MWDGIYVRNSALGVLSEAGPSAPNVISHSFQGIVFEDADPNVLAPAPFFRFKWTRFLHNRQSLEIHRAIAPANGGDQVMNCYFDSDPQAFKAPWRYQSTFNQYYSLRHMFLGGNFSNASFADNELRHSLYGIVGNTADTEPVTIVLQNHRFEDFYLAGVFSTHLSMFYKGDYQLNNNTFLFPADPVPLSTAQTKNESYATLPQYLDETFGVYLREAQELRVTDSRFQQLDSTQYPLINYDQFAGARGRQTGIWSANLPYAYSNTFYLLDQGVILWDINASTPSVVGGNSFVHCRQALGLRAGQSDSASYGIVHAYCNTMRRDTWRAGTTIGIRQYYAPTFITSNQNFPPSYWPRVVIDDPANPGVAYMKNWFDDHGGSVNGTYRSIQNDQTAVPLDYRTFGEGSPTPNPLYYSHAEHDLDLAVGPVNIPTSGARPNALFNQFAQTCQNLPIPTPPGTGIQARGTVAASTGVKGKSLTNSLSQSWPNPASRSTTVPYTLRTTAHEAALVVHRITDGREITRVPLDVHRTEYELRVQGWPAGMYVVTLVVDGTPAATRRVVVE